MKATLLMCFVVGLTSAEYGWKVGSQYNYELRGRTLTGLHQASDQYSGMNTRAKIVIQPKENSLLSVQVHGAEFAEIHSNLSGGWNSEIPDEKLDYSPLPINSEPFEVQFQNGTVSGMLVDRDLPIWEVNMLKSIVSLLQINTNGENLKKSNINSLPSGGDVSGVYKTMEDSIHGKYETMYDISELPESKMQKHPEMAPLRQLRGNGKFINIIKTRNLSDSEQHMVYHHGMSGVGKWEPGSNIMGDFLSRSSGSRIVLSGSLQRYIIQSSVTDEKIVLSPHLYNKQKGMVVTRLNLTLEGLMPAPGPAPAVNNPLKIKDLIYQYQSEKGEHSKNSASNEDTSNSSDTSSSSSEHNENTSRGSKYNSSESSSDSASSSSSSSSSSSQSSESLSSSEEFYQRLSTLDQTPQAPFLAFYVGYSGQPIHTARDFNSIDKIIQLSRSIGRDIQNPEMMTAESTLSKFISLTRLIRTMNLEQQKLATDKLYITQSQAQQKPSGTDDFQAWIAFRDAVAQAGTGPALLTIKDWIKSNKIQGQEAAQLVATLPSSARLPTKEYMEAFYEMILDENTESQNWLNTSAVLSFADLVRKSMVDAKDMHSRYPVHVFGPTKAKSDEVLEKYIQHFDEKLYQAVEEGDSTKIQVYINALGSIGHRQILSSYEPYLEGQRKISNYQRLVMVAAMSKMAKVYPDETRNVLYRIYQNSAESPEIRTAAVMQIMKTKPSAQMLQRMAEQTHFDHSKQVSAAVKSAIESAARQPVNKYNKQLTENARAAVDMLSPDNYGLQSSRNFIRSFMVKGENLGYKHQLSYIQSRDSLLPKSVFYTLKRNLGGYKCDSHEMQFMTSSVDELIRQLTEQFYNPSKIRSNVRKQNDRKKGSRSSGQNWSFEKVNQMLDFEEQNQDQVEGNFLITAFGEQRYFSFDNNTIAQFPQMMHQMKSSLESGKTFNLTKFYNQYSYHVAFPTAMGLPFVYSMDLPSMISFVGSAKISDRSQKSREKEANVWSMADIVTVDGSYDIVYSAKREGQMSIVSPFNNKVYSAGLEKNVQVRIPVRASVGVDLKNKRVDSSFEPLQKDKQQKVFEISSDAYTTAYNILDMEPAKNKKDTKKLNVERSQEINTAFGDHSAGLVFDVNFQGEGRPLDLSKFYEKSKHYDFMSYFLYGDMGDEINSNNLTVVYNPQKSSANKMKLSLQYTSEKAQKVANRESYNKHKNGRVPQNGDNLALPSSKDRMKRQEELLKNAMNGIQNAEAHGLNIALTFDGKQKREYVANVAYASSPAVEDSRFLVYYLNSTSFSPKQYQAALQFNMKRPQVPLFNFREALNADPTSEIKGRLDFGENTPLESTLVIEGEMKSSPERREYLRKHPLTGLCEKQMQAGYYIQPACRNMTARANYLDSYQLTVSYQNLPGKLQNFSHVVYAAARHFGHEYNKENFVNVINKESQVELKANFSRGLRKVNVSLTLPELNSKFEEVPIHEWIRPALVMHPNYGIMERLGQRIFLGQQYRK